MSAPDTDRKEHGRDYGDDGEFALVKSVGIV